MPIMGVGELGRLSIKTIGSGPLYLFRNGRVFEGIWKRPALDEPLALLNETDDPLSFANGQTWLMVLPGMDRVTWE